jgi:hypothetical protein
MLDGVAFLPEGRVEEGIRYLEGIAPDSADELLTYFTTTYVGVFRQDPAAAPGMIRLLRVPPLFPPSIWNVHESTMNGDARTNNFCEGWNSGFRKLLGGTHPTIAKAVDGMKADATLVKATIARDAVGRRLQRRKKQTYVTYQRRLRNLCDDLNNGRKTLPEFLRAVGRNIVLMRRSEPDQDA